MSIFRSNSILVNKNLTSNDTISCSCDNFYCFHSSMNSLVFFIVFLHCRRSDNNLRYFAQLYFAVFSFETIGRIGRLLIPPFIESLCILAAPWNLPGHYSVRYNFLYSCSGNFNLFSKVSVLLLIPMIF